MNSASSKFYRDFILVIVFCAAGAYLVARYMLHSSVPLSFWLSSAFISGITLIIHKVLVGANATRRPQTFVTYFMGALTGKLLLSAMILLIVGIADRDHLKFTAIGFFVVYVLLTAVELMHLLPLVRRSDD